jgi:SAM-dependent methyltransferase
MTATPPSSPTQQAWSNLWATGVADTFGSSDDGRDGPLAAQWRQWFANMPPGCRVLDLGTGNGALPRLLLQAGCDAGVDAVDVAQLRPKWMESLPPTEQQRVRFHAGVSCETLPFEAGSFDYVVSQFGIEYADLDAALPEALRVLKPGGVLRCVIHHVAARPATLAREEITHAAWLIDSGWLDAAREMSAAMALMSQPHGRERLNTEPRWQAARLRFDGFQKQLAERAASSVCPDLLADAQGWLTQVFQAAARRGDDAAQAGMIELGRLLHEGPLRLQDLLDHALDENRIHQVAAAIIASGRVAQVEPAEDAGHLMGWWLSASPQSPRTSPC